MIRVHILLFKLSALVETIHVVLSLNKVLSQTLYWYGFSPGCASVPQAKVKLCCTSHIDMVSSLCELHCAASVCQAEGTSSCKSYTNMVSLQYRWDYANSIYQPKSKLCCIFYRNMVSPLCGHNYAALVSGPSESFACCKSYINIVLPQNLSGNADFR